MDEDSFKQQTPGKNWTEIPYIFLYTTVKFGVSKKKKNTAENSDLPSQE